MADDKYTFETARIRLEEIAAEVRKKDTSLEKSLDLLEEGVRLANICTELVDHTDMSASVAVPVVEPDENDVAEDAGAADAEDGIEPDASEDAVQNPGASDGDGFDETDDEVAEQADPATAD